MSIDQAGGAGSRVNRQRQRPASTRRQSGPAGWAGTPRSPGVFEHDLNVAWRAIEELRLYERNARRHSRQQIEKLAASIREFGFLIAVLTDKDSRVIAGHARLEAAKRLGLTRVPTVEIGHLSDAQVRAFRIADNRLAELATWDERTLALELQGLAELDLGSSLEITGFEHAEIDLMIEDLDQHEPDAADDIPDLEGDEPPLSRLGDLWLLGQHRLLCADARVASSYERLMVGTSARAVFTDPPYNVPIDRHASGLGNTKHPDFVMGSGEMSQERFTGFLEDVLRQLSANCLDGALVYTCMDWRHCYELLTAARSADLGLLNICVWNKDNGGMGSLYRSKHELVFVLKVGTAPHLNNVELGRFGRSRTNVWDYPGANSLGAGRLDDLAMHPTVKPVALVADAIKDCTARGDIVLDAFAGSGTTLIAAHQTGRIGCALELDPRYVDVAIRRWQQLTGEQATHAESGRSFDDVAEVRGPATDRSDPMLDGQEAGHGA